MSIRQLYVGPSDPQVTIEKIRKNPDDFYVIILNMQLQHSEYFLETIEQTEIKCVFKSIQCVNYRYPYNGPKLQMFIFTVNGEAHATRL